MTTKKYEFTGETNYKGLKRIRALRDIPEFSVKAGDLGGWLESESNLSHEGKTWVSGNAWVYGNAGVSGNARVFGDAQVSGNAWVFGDAQVSGYAALDGPRQISHVSLPSLKYPEITVINSGAHIFIGCQEFTLKQLKKRIESISQNTQGTFKRR